MFLYRFVINIYIYILQRVTTIAFKTILRSVNFNVNNTFQQQLANDFKEINCTKKIIAPVDKTRNLCKVKKENYDKKYLSSNISKTYKKSTTLFG